MPTLRQRKVAKRMVEALEKGEEITGGSLLKSVDYGTGLQRSPGRVLESEGVKEALEDLGFTEENAKRVVTEIMLSRDVDPSARLKATDQVFKVNGSYAPEKSLNLNLNKEATQGEVDLELMALEMAERLKEQKT